MKAIALLPMLLAAKNVDSFNGSRRMAKARKNPKKYARKYGLDGDDMASITMDNASIGFMEERSNVNIFESKENLFSHSTEEDVGINIIVPPTIDNTPANLPGEISKPNIFDELGDNLTDGSKAFTFHPSSSPSLSSSGKSVGSKSSKPSYLVSHFGCSYLDCVLTLSLISCL